MIIALPLTCLVSCSQTLALFPSPTQAFFVLQVTISWVGPGNEASQTQPGLGLGKTITFSHAQLHSQHWGGYLWNIYPTEALVLILYTFTLLINIFLTGMHILY